MPTIEELEEFDKLKTKVLKYVLYKKRSEAEVRRKFADANDEMLDEVIQNLSENGYINDNSYIEKAVQEFMRLKNMSIKEIEYKLLSKGINKDKIENYIFENREALLEYEQKSAKHIFIKKQTIMEEDNIIQYLKKKGYLSETIKLAKE